MGKSESAYQRLYTVLQEGRKAIPQEKIDYLIRSIDKRVESVRLARG
jgi:hypothetical protein